MSLLLLFNQSLSDTGAVGQNVLDLMELLNAELQLQPGEQDVTKAITALNAAQDFFESLASQHPDVLGSQVGEFSTDTGEEAITYPLGLLRLDRLFLMQETDTTQVERELISATRPAGHVQTTGWPWNIINTAGTGKPYIFWTNGRNIYFNPKPGGDYPLRWVGFIAQDNITADGDFMYPDMCMLPFASFATRLIKSGIDDNPADLIQLAVDTFEPVIKSMSNFKRISAGQLIYTQNHDT